MNKKLEYKLINQKYACCVPTCLLMILERRNFSLMSQEDIGWELGLVVPKEKEKFFSKVRTGKKSRAGWGTQVDKEEFSVNNFFKKYKIPLKEKNYFIESFKGDDEIRNFIIENIEKSNDMIVCFNYGKLYDTKYDGGHVSLVSSIECDDIILIDPNEKLPKIRKVKLDKLIQAMKIHKGKSGGFWIIH